MSNLYLDKRRCKKKKKDAGKDNWVALRNRGNRDKKRVDRGCFLLLLPEREIFVWKVWRHGAGGGGVKVHPFMMPAFRRRQTAIDLDGTCTWTFLTVKLLLLLLFPLLLLLLLSISTRRAWSYYTRRLELPRKWIILWTSTSDHMVVEIFTRKSLDR